MSQPSHPTLINLPQPPSNPDTPSEMPGTPTSTTTSLSTLSTTAIKDGHRGHGPHGSSARGHHHNLSSTSLEAERADRISRLPGMSTVSTLRGPLAGPGQHISNSPQITPTSTGFPPMSHTAAPGGLTPAYFDQSGQPVAATKMSTVGSASATESVGGHTTTEMGGENYTVGGRDDDDDEDMLSMGTDDRGTETEMDSAGSASGYGGPPGLLDAMDEDLDHDRLDPPRFIGSGEGAFDDRMSDDGNASLVGFGEGAGSTVSGPIYHRRPLPGGTQYQQYHGSAASAMAAANNGIGNWGAGLLERSSSGLSASNESGLLRRDNNPSATRMGGGGGLDREVGGNDTPVSQTAMMERREARMVDGVALDTGTSASAMAAVASARASIGGTGAAANDDMFVDTTTRGPIPIVGGGGAVGLPVQHPTSALRETQQHRQQQQHRQTGSSASNNLREIVRESLRDNGEGRV
ncbi:hypothetical protein B0H66DRAFT_389303 [Apodospora peruviana]|uniref:Uncharacterized protein n=1 Tax=Apodospora peruviana TaxID=516989 RepID=A0AAE0HUR3_9PEZI|nr:hypothetical protein B0H66DRAFT_389303 [Apodospora peruviana]